MKHDNLYSRLVELVGPAHAVKISAEANSTAFGKYLGEAVQEAFTDRLQKSKAKGHKRD